ncbi:MAG: hypothetical protein Ct9H300mP3_10800 [Gammaproteobacteria bacterium]|nr:MAG: hypothetical protein Ct9H300mP3_10800 [Gammaproteobacteria bacterium]
MERARPRWKRNFLSRKGQRLPKWENLFKEATIQSGLHWTFLAAISYQESHWDPQAISKTGVRGLMMLTQTTAKEFGEYLEEQILNKVYLVVQFISNAY